MAIVGPFLNPRQPAATGRPSSTFNGHIVTSAVLRLTTVVRDATATPTPTDPPTLTPSPTTTLPPTEPPAARIYWGAWLDGPPAAEAFQPGGLIHDFESQVGKGMAIVHWGQAWKWNGENQAFPAAHFNNIRSHGSIPMLDWGSWVAGAGPEQPDFALQTILAGAHDGHVQQWAEAAKAYGHPFFLRFNWEMNGTWQYPWSEQLNGNQPGEYARAWQHVHDIFSQAGAANVTWVWCPNVSSSTTVPYAALYPGDEYVDWMCLTGFNSYPQWLSFEAVITARGITWLDNSYEELQRLAPIKPLVVVTGSLDAGDGGAGKADWIANALGPQLPQRFPAIKALVWFNWDGGNPDYATLPVDSSPASLAAFADAIGAAYFAPNEFGDLAGAPISVLD